MQNTKPKNFRYTTSKRTKNKRKRNKRRFLKYILSCALLLFVGAIITLFILYKDINYEYRVELGDPMPLAEVFSKSGDVSVEYITDITEADELKVGSNWIHISVGGNDRLVNLIIKDTIAPEAQPVELSISISEKVSPEQLVSDIKDAGMVKLQWEKAPEFGTAGDYSVVIMMQDMSHNTSSVTSLLHIRAVVDILTYEAGEKLPELQEFLADETLDAEFITDISTLSLDTPGEYDVSIEVNGRSYTSCLAVTDTVEPEIAVQSVYIYPGERIEPEDFVSSKLDATALSFELLGEPDYNKIGFQEVCLIATDLGGNTTDKTATLLISNVEPITLEIRDTKLAEDEFVDISSYETVTFTKQIIPDTLGEYEVEVVLDGQINPTKVTVVDTTPPNAETKDVTWYLDHPLSADNFVKNAFDYTQIAYSFFKEPDWAKSDTQSVGVVLTDTTGNSSQYTCSLTLEYDTEAPSLYGVNDRYCYIGQAVAYFADVFAQDNCDFETTVDVDNSLVNINTAGKYEVSYSATDSSGNTVEKSCEFTFVEETITDEELDTAAEQALSTIITDDMSIGKKAYEVFKYVNNHVKYSGTSNKEDWKYEAYRGIISGRGDCFTFYAVAKGLLEKIGAQTMCVERHGGSNPNHHYWLLVNLGTGWYHFDAINVGPRNFDCFMKTDKQLLARGRNWWSFDRTLFPPSPDESFVLE